MVKEGKAEKGLAETQEFTLGRLHINVENKRMKVTK
jgi:hypothetical protein